LEQDILSLWKLDIFRNKQKYTFVLEKKQQTSRHLFW